MSQEKKVPKILTEELAQKHLERVKKGNLDTLTDRIWVHYPREPKKQEKKFPTESMLKAREEWAKKLRKREQR